MAIKNEIPKIIHYFWFGKGQKPDIAKKCIDSWKKYCPDYQIIEWNETNFDIRTNKYISEAYDQKKYAFVSDFARLKTLYEYGGIYLDIDVEIIKPLTKEMIRDGFLAEEEPSIIATGLGFSCRKGDETIGLMMKDYEAISFIKENGELDLTPCPLRNTNAIKDRICNGMAGSLKIYGPEFFNPKDYRTGIVGITDNTISIHHGTATWLDDIDKNLYQYRQKCIQRYGRTIGYPLYYLRKTALYARKKPTKLVCLVKRRLGGKK